MEGPKLGQGVVVQGQKGPREPPGAIGTDLGRGSSRTRQSELKPFLIL